MKIRAVVKRPDEPFGHMANVSNTLQNLQNIVDGYIEVVDCGNGLLIICNEEGKIQELEPNIPNPNSPQDDELVGTIIVCGQNGVEFGHIPIEFAEWKEMLKKIREERSKAWN